jgi:hypothetical protein
MEIINSQTTILLGLIYMGKILWQKRVQFCAAIMTPLLALATLGNTTQMERSLFLLCHSKLPRQMLCQLLRITIAGGFALVLAKNFASVNTAF